MSLLQKVTGAFFGFQIGMLSLMTLLSALHDHPLLQIVVLGAIAYVGVKFFKGRSRAAAEANTQSTSNDPSPTANAAQAQPAATATSQARTAPSPVYRKSSVIAFKSQP